MNLDAVLTTREKTELLQGLGREPSAAELVMISAMWSEHCGYKHSRYFLKDLPREGDHVLAGPGENAGIIGISDTLAVAFKIESHNHPSAVVPYQGAATGVGGILRDIFTMGSEPIALMNSLHFDIRDHRGQWICEHVVDGIADYGNCTGIPTVGGEYASYPWFKDNPLVNVVCAGTILPEHVLKASTAKAGDRVLYFGNKTGRDGIAGAIFASLNLTDETRAQKSAVQVADPFMGKLILQASLELIRRGVPSAMQDMGAAGITCSTSEIAHKSGCGIDVDLGRVPVRSEDITAEEILLSESQERMLATVPADSVALAEEILNKYPLDYGWVGTLNTSDKIKVDFQGEQIVDMPLELLVDGCPTESYTHLTEEQFRAGGGSDGYLSSARDPAFRVGSDKAGAPDKAALLALYEQVSHYASQRYIYDQFDHDINLRTVGGPGGDHILLYDPDSKRMLNLVVHSRSAWTGCNAYRGTRAVLAGVFRRSISAGCYPLGLSNCLNFPSPEREATVIDFGGTTLAMTEFCKAMEVPVTGGNVSFYNESEAGAIPPTPVFVTVGESVLGIDRLKPAGQIGSLYLTGRPSLRSGDVYTQWLLAQGRSLSTLEIPIVDWAEELALGQAWLDLYRQHAQHVWIRDIGKGGAYKRFIEHFAQPDRDIECDAGESVIDVLFGEGAASYLIFVPDDAPSEVAQAVTTAGARRIGTVKAGTGRLRAPGGWDVDVCAGRERADLSLDPFLMQHP